MLTKPTAIPYSTNGHLAASRGLTPKHTRMRLAGQDKGLDTKEMTRDDRHQGREGREKESGHCAADRVFLLAGAD